MPAFILELRSQELADAINNLAAAHMAEAKALSRLADGCSPAYGPTGYSCAYPARPAGAQPVFIPQPCSCLPAESAPPFCSAPYIHPSQPPTAVYPAPAGPKAAAISQTITASDQNQAKDQPPGGGHLTLDDLARAAASLMGAGKYLLLVDLLARFGVQALFQLPQEHFDSFAAALRQLGAPI